jgi:hypothetical protein
MAPWKKSMRCFISRAVPLVNYLKINILIKKSDRLLEVHPVLRDLTCYDDQRQMYSQVGLLVVNANIVMAVECKSQLSVMTSMST